MNLALRLLASVFLSLVLVTPSLAARGQCGQPANDGDKPLASDALFILRGSVGLVPCGICTCDIDGNGQILAGDALGVLRASVDIPVELGCGLCDGAGVAGVLTAPDGSIEPLARSAQERGVVEILPVAGALIELHEIDSNGVSLRLLDAEPTDDNGNFSFETSTGLGTGLILHALDSQGTRVFSALATKAETDIDGASEFVLSLVLDSEAPSRGASPGLSNFSAQEYNDCVEQTRAVVLEEIPTDARAFVAAILQATGGILSAQITAFAQSPDTNDLLDGEFWATASDLSVFARFTPGAINATPDTNSRGVGFSGATVRLSFDGAGGLLNGFFQGTEVRLTKVSGTQRFDDPGADTKINADVTVETEDDTELDPPSTYNLAGDNSGIIDFGDGDLLPFLTNADGDLLGFTVTESEPSEGPGTDAEFFRGFGFGFPVATSASDALFSGAYHTIDVERYAIAEVFGPTESNRQVGFYSGVSEVSADGSGTFTFSELPGGIETVLFEQGHTSAQPPFDPNVILFTEEVDELDPSEELDYEISANGALTISIDGETLATGAISPTGDLAFLHSFEQDGNDSSHEPLTFVKKGSGMDKDGVAGRYTLTGSEVCLEKEFIPGSFDGPFDASFRAVCVSTFGGTAELASNGTLVLPALVIDEVCLDEFSNVEFSTFNPAGRVFDANVSFFRATEADLDVPGTWDVTSNGKLTVTLPDSEADTDLSGAAAPDGSFFFLQGLTEQNDNGFEADSCVAQLFGVRMSGM